MFKAVQCVVSDWTRGACRSRWILDELSRVSGLHHVFVLSVCVWGGGGVLIRVISKFSCSNSSDQDLKEEIFYFFPNHFQTFFLLTTALKQLNRSINVHLT